jgi:hypothetical protein
VPALVRTIVSFVENSAIAGSSGLSNSPFTFQAIVANFTLSLTFCDASMNFRIFCEYRIGTSDMVSVP